MAKIPTQKENAKGLHQRYYIQKVKAFTDEEKKHLRKVAASQNPPYGFGVEIPDFKLVDIDKDAEYFVLRLDAGGSDINHIKACRIGIHAYADAIEPFIPELAKDLRERYPLL